MLNSIYFVINVIINFSFPKKGTQEYNDYYRNVFLLCLKNVDADKRDAFKLYFFKNLENSRRHKFHIVSSSPWPFFLALTILFIILHFISILYRDFSAVSGFFYGLLLLIFVIIF